MGLLEWDTAEDMAPVMVMAIMVVADGVVRQVEDTGDTADTAAGLVGLVMEEEAALVVGGLVLALEGDGDMVDAVRKRG
ncbi:uncharacterized protein N7482_010791 [Penicillium canariense]|uniref:Uncharacterized protein n=1 Tax=Penicillium canariense TaxID=189055 RepID=A0A9W9LDM9_9EURO|nr:uncharacterized protein N7482_010791 [Penicillium canariense]KAJ5150333.1 hypothetical protein N7482_010791 [Penicillium canariense]